MALTKEERDLLQTVVTDTKAVTKRLEEIESKPAGGGPSPRQMFGFQQPGEQWHSKDWGRYADLDARYPAQALDMLHGRERKVSGMGECFVKMAALAGDPVAKQYAAQLPGWSSDYNSDKLEEQYGCTTIIKAKERGIPRYDPRTRKVLLNERRKTALAENAGQQGGYTLPPQFMSELLTVAAEDGFIEQRAKQIPMNSRTADWPMLDITTKQSAGTTPYFGGIHFGWQPEASTYTETEPTFRQSTWTAWDLVGVTVSSNQLLADSGIGLDALLTQLFGQAITWYKEYAFLQGLGAGSSMPLGIINAPATILQGRVTPGHFKLADAAAMLSHLQIRSWESACWIMHQSVITDLIQMVDNNTSNRLVWMTPFGDGKQGPVAMKLPMAFLNGLPIYFTEKLNPLGTAGDVMLVDWSRYVIGNRMDLQIDVSPHVKFQQNQLMWRVIARCDGKPWMNGPVTDATGSWTISPFIVLS